MMADVSLREALDDLVTDVAPRQTSPGRQIVRLARRRARYRRASVAAACVGVVVLAVTAFRAEWRPSHPSGDRTAAPTVASITCAGGGVSVQPSTIAASADGVHLRLADATGAADVEFRLRPDAPWEPAQALITPPPGTIEIGCLHAGSIVGGAPATLHVTDPHHYWSNNTYPPFDCNLSAAPDTTPASTGRDPTAAAQSLAITQGLHIGPRQGGYAEHDPVYFAGLLDESLAGGGTVPTPVEIIKVSRVNTTTWRAITTVKCPAPLTSPSTTG
jgi:hypothetical protein